MVKTAHQKDHKDDIAMESDRSLDQAARAAGAAAVAETDRLAQAASEDASYEMSVLEILGDQTRHSLEAAMALGRARHLAEVAQVQSDFLSDSFGRAGQLGERYLALLRGGMMSPSSNSRH